MTAAGRHNAPAPMPGKVAVAALGGIAGFDVTGGAILLATGGNELACMGLVYGSVLAVTTVLCLYYAEKVDP